MGEPAPGPARPPTGASRKVAPRAAEANSSPLPCTLSSLSSQEFNIQKLQMVEAEKAKIKKEYERKESQVEVKKKM